MTFGEFARLKRIESGKTQQVCAEAIGQKTKGGYQRLEIKNRRWFLDQAQSFAKLFEMPLSELIAEYEQENQ